MNYNVFLVLIAIAVLYVVYALSKKKSSDKSVKEHFDTTYDANMNLVADSLLSDTVTIEDSPAYWRRLNSNLVNSNTVLQSEIETLNYELEQVSILIGQYTSSNATLTVSITNLEDLNSNLIDHINRVSGCQDDYPKYGISNCDSIFDVNTLGTYKTTMERNISELITSINNMLVHDKYDEVPLSNNFDIDVDTITGVIDKINDVKRRYNNLFNDLSNLPSNSNLETSDWATTASTIMTEAQSNCLARDQTRTCIYAESNTDGEVTRYFTSNMEHTFCNERWPSEFSCIKDPEDLCAFKDGILSSSNCDGRQSTCYDLFNGGTKDGQIAYNSASYGYTSTQLSDDEWKCELNYPDENSVSPLTSCKTESDIQGSARANCEGNGGQWGVLSYACYTNENTNESNGYATYNGSEQMPSVSSQSSGGQSKTWSAQSNADGSIGQCSVNSNCRTETETSDMATCLSQTDSNDYRNNYRCYGTTGSNDTISKVDNSNYKNKYQLGSFNSDNEWSTGSCRQAHSNYSECRTKPDVETEVAWKNSNNWQCHTYSNGEVNALEEWNKNYERIGEFGDITESNQGIGVSTTSSNCRKEEDVEAQRNCLNTNQYDCWKVRTSNLDNSNVIRNYNRNWNSNDRGNNELDWQFNEFITTSPHVDGMKRYGTIYTIQNKHYTVIDDTTSDDYVNKTSFESNCSEMSSNCETRQSAISNLTAYCESNDVRSNCYEMGQASNNQFGDQVSWSIVYDSNNGFGQYNTRVHDDANYIKCMKREEDQCSTQSTVCEGQSNKCYIQPSYNSNNSSNFFDRSSSTNYEYRPSAVDTDGSNCVAPNSCVTLPYCSYMTVDTSSGTSFYWNQIGQNDCSEPSEGKRYRWTLESSKKRSVRNPSREVSDMNAWIPVNNKDVNNSDLDVSENSNCERHPTFSGIQVTTLNSNEDGTNFICECDENNRDHYQQMRFFRYSNYTDNGGEGYSNVNDLQNDTCSDNECRTNDYYTAKVRKVDCLKPDSTDVLGDEHIAISNYSGGLNCYNVNACSNLCLVSGPSNDLQIGDGVNDDEVQSNPAQCYEYGKTTQQNRYTYAANGFLMGTCTDLVGSNCSSNQNENCGQHYTNDNIPDWGDPVYIEGTTDNGITTYRDEEPYTGTVVRYGGAGVTSITDSNIEYNSSCHMHCGF